MECLIQYLDDFEDLLYAIALKAERIRMAVIFFFCMLFLCILQFQHEFLSLVSDNFFSQIKITLGTCGCGIIKQYRFAEAGCLAESNVSGYHGFKYKIFEIFFGFFCDLVSQIGASVKHGQ